MKFDLSKLGERERPINKGISEYLAEYKIDLTKNTTITKFRTEV